MVLITELHHHYVMLNCKKDIKQLSPAVNFVLQKTKDKNACTIRNWSHVPQVFSESSNADNTKKDISVIHSMKESYWCYPLYENVTMVFCRWIQGLQIAVSQGITSKCM